MPAWFVTLAYICLTVLMVSFLLCVAIPLVGLIVAGILAWLDDRKMEKALKNGKERDV